MAIIQPTIICITVISTIITDLKVSMKKASTEAITLNVINKYCYEWRSEL